MQRRCTALCSLTMRDSTGPAAGSRRDGGDIHSWVRPMSHRDRASSEKADANRHTTSTRCWQNSSLITGRGRPNTTRLYTGCAAFSQVSPLPSCDVPLNDGSQYRVVKRSTGQKNSPPGSANSAGQPRSIRPAVGCSPVLRPLAAHSVRFLANAPLSSENGRGPA
jgi:hypothetical protein